MADALNMKIAKLLLSEEPGLLACEMSANARACAALASNLGSLLATLKAKKGQAYYEQAAKAVFKHIDDAAKDVHARAAHMAENEPRSAH